MNYRALIRLLGLAQTAPSATPVPRATRTTAPELMKLKEQLANLEPLPSNWQLQPVNEDGRPWLGLPPRDARVEESGQPGAFYLHASFPVPKIVKCFPRVRVFFMGWECMTTRSGYHDDVGGGTVEIMQRVEIKQRQTR